MRAGANFAREFPGETDAVLVTAVARGESAAFRQLTDRHLEAVHRLASRMLGDWNEVEEVAQETFLKLWIHASRWRPTAGDTGVRPWLRRLAINACIDRLRRRRFQSDADVPEQADDDASAADQIDRRRLGDLVTDALLSLSERQRAAIVLTYYEELPNAEAAAAMDMHVKAFESLLLRARQALKSSIAAMGIGAADLQEVA